MDKVEFQLRANQDVITPNGPGTFQGYIQEADGRIERVIVSHDPKKVKLPDHLLEGWTPGPWVLVHYPIGQVKLFVKP